MLTFNKYVNGLSRYYGSLKWVIEDTHFFHHIKKSVTLTHTVKSETITMDFYWPQFQSAVIFTLRGHCCILLISSSSSFFTLSGSRLSGSSVYKFLFHFTQLYFFFFTVLNIFFWSIWEEEEKKAWMQQLKVETPLHYLHIFTYSCLQSCFSSGTISRR